MRLSLDSVEVWTVSQLSNRVRGTSTGEEEEEEETGEEPDEEFGFMYSRTRLLGGGKRHIHPLDLKMAVIGIVRSL